MSDINDQIRDLEAQVEAMENTTTTEQTSSVEEPVTSTPEPAAEATSSSDEMIQQMVERKVAAELSAIKSKLDDAYAARDAAVKQKVMLEEEKRAESIKRMEEEGRHKEVAELKLAELQAKVEALTAKNTELSRDHVVSGALTGLDFRSEMAGEMARDRILKELTQDENGQWLHKSGVSIKEFVDHFSKSDENAFLFKAKVNSGAGTQAPVGAVTPKTDKKITEMSTEEMLAHFSQGTPGQTGGF